MSGSFFYYTAEKRGSEYWIPSIIYYRKAGYERRCHKFDILYVKSISRFARNTVTTITAIRELNGYDIKTMFEKENPVSTDPSTNIMLSLMASTAESESLSISENVNLGPKYKYSRGMVCQFHQLSWL